MLFASKVVVCLVVLAVTSPALAQGQTGEFAGSVTGAWTDVELAIGSPEYQPSGFMVEGSWFFNENIGVTAEFGYATGSNLVLELDTITAAGGVRFRFPTGSIVTPSLRATVGVARLDLDLLSFPNDTANDLAVTVGGSIDFRVTDNLAIRVQPDVLVVEHFDPVMFRLGFGVMYAFGGPLGRPRAPAPRPTTVEPAEPVAQQPAGGVAVARPEAAQPIAAGAIPPEGTAPPSKLAESARWTALTGGGVGYEWSVTIGNGNAVARTARAIATLYDAAGTPLFTVEAEEEIPANGTLLIARDGELRRTIAERGDHWTITVAWVVR